MTILTISHTNQQSKFEPLWKRLDLTARSGNNEIPGELRCFVSFSALHYKEILALELDPECKYVAVCSAKASEFTPQFTKEKPAIFQLQEGEIQYVDQIDALLFEELVKKNRNARVIKEN